jgi:hypothetical protein
MLMKSYEPLSDGVTRFRIMNADDMNAEDKLNSAFEWYRSRRVILNDCFADDVWTLTNETNDIRLALSFADGMFAASEWLGCGAGDYRDCMKAYVVVHLGSLQLATLQCLVRLFNRIGNMTADEASSIVRDAHHALAFLKLLPGISEYRDSVIEALEVSCAASASGGGDKHQRTLSEFSNYLRFNEVIDTFWQTASREQKLLYFPIFFWWNLTAVLPLRVTEFLLTPRDCLEGRVLTVRRTKLKGGAAKISYRIADDYEYCRYSVSERIANEIRWYARETENMRRTDLDTLLLLEPHFAGLGKKTQTRNRYYSYDDLSDTLRCFCNENFAGQDTGIKSIRLGDTRHLAMISLIISGGSPVICRELAGHADINISSGYYANISTFVECIAVERFRRAMEGAAKLNGENYYPVTSPASFRRVSGGNCSAPSVGRGDVGECIKAISNDGRIGDCESCRHYWPDMPGVRARFRDAGINKKLVDKDSQHLIRMIELVRRGMGCHEDIGAAILRLQHSCHRLSDCLAEKYINEGDM